MNVAKFLIWFWLLFLWLAYMKESVELIAKTVSLEQYSHFSIWWYVLIGTLITSIMQTSTGTTIITLTALSAKIITLDMALWIVIWANLWSAITTTIMWLLSSSPTQIQKKKVALSHLIFNVTTTIIVTLLYPYIRDLLLYIQWWKWTNIIIVAMFNTTFNIILAMIWTPLLWHLLKLLHFIYPSKKSDLHLAIDNINTTLAEEVLHALEKDCMLLLEKVKQYNRHVLYLDHTPHYSQKTEEDYIIIKKIEDRLLKYIITYWFAEDKSHTVHALNDVIIQAITSSKYLKDIQNHIINLKDESLNHTIIAESLHFFQTIIEKTCIYIQNINTEMTADSNVQALETAITTLHTNDDYHLENVAKQLDNKEIESINIAEIIKTNRYVLLSCEALLRSHIDYLKK